MISWLARQFHYVYGLLNTHDSPRQLALGCAFGVLLGLLPKGNLLAVFIATLFFTLRVNLSVGMLAAVLLSFITGYIDPVAHRLGFYLLSAPALRPLWTQLFNTPIVPWTRFSNTVVLGNFVLGVFMFCPVYLAMTPVFARWKEYQRRRRSRQSVAGAGGDASPARLAWRRRQLAELLAEVESLSRYRRAA